jgi:hypothetical protein
MLPLEAFMRPIRLNMRSWKSKAVDWRKRGDGVEVVAQREVAAREGLADMAVREEVHGCGDDGGRRRVAAEEELLLACARRGHGAHAAREERVDEARVYERLGDLECSGSSGGSSSSDREGSGHLFLVRR